MSEAETEGVEVPFPLVADETLDRLNEFGPRVREDYEEFKQEFITWLATEGKNPKRRRGYAETTIRATSYKIESTFRWFWNQLGKYSLEFKPEDADEFMDTLAMFSDYHDSTLLVYVKAINRFFSFKNQRYGANYGWECDIELSQKNQKTRDYFRQSEFPALYEAALTYNTVKSYNNSGMTPEERDKVKAHVAQRLGIPKRKVGPEEFKKANSWKIPSIVAVTLDTGLRPIEVGRAKTSWVDLEHGELRIPKEESTKNYENWTCALSDTAVKALKRWLNERDAYEIYQDRERLWLTERGNPYSSASLNYLLEQLLEESEIEARGRNLTWYSIRHGVATLWANEEGLHHAQEQLRHKSTKTTMKYVHSDSQKRGTKADSMW